MPRKKRRSTARTKRPRRQRGNQRTESLWDLDRDGVTYSMLSRFVVDPERFRLHAVEGWEETGLNIPIQFGSCFHDCLENHAAGYPTSTENVIRHYQSTRTSSSAGPDDREALAKCCGMVSVIFPIYIDYWQAHDVRREVLHQEATFEFKHPLVGVGIEPRNLTIRGRWDSVYQEDGELWLQENKTKGQVDEEYIMSTLHQNLQTMMYCLALRAYYKRCPDGVLYNVVRRPQLRPRKTETLKAFVDRVHDDVLDRPEWYFMRYTVQLIDTDLEKWVQHQFNPILYRLCMWWDSIRHDPFDPWVTKDGRPNLQHFQRPFGVYDALGVGGRGEYYELLTKGSYFGLTQRADLFPELVD